MLVVDGVIGPARPEPIERVAAMLRVDRELALAVAMELGRDGFLELAGEDGVRVRPLAEWPGDEIVQLRRLLEPHATRSAAAHARTADLIVLRDLAGAVAEALAARDYVDFCRADQAFAEALVSLVPNAELGRLCGELRARTAHDGLRVPVEQGVLSPVLWAHADVVDLIEAGDLAAVEALARANIDRLPYVGAPVMDAPHLAGAPIALEPEVDIEFLDAAADA